jgi:protein TonB
MSFSTNRTKMYIWFVQRRRWLIAFSLVLSMHLAVIAMVAYSAFDEQSPLAAPQAAVMVMFSVPEVASAKQQVEVHEPLEVEVEPETDNALEQPASEDIALDQESNIGQHQVNNHKAPEREIIDKTLDTKLVENTKEQAIEETENVELEAVDEANTEVVETKELLSEQVALYTEKLPVSDAIADNVNELAIAQWQHQVQAHLERLKRYPAIALKQKRQGVVSVTFNINSHGEILSSTLTQSSGVHILDRATLALVSRADPLPKPPEVLIKQHQSIISVEVPIRYSIHQNG